MLIDKSIQRVRAYRCHAGLSVNALAVKAGMAESTLRRMDRPDWSPTADTLRRLEAIIPADFGSTDPAAEAVDQRGAA